jgi:hypothetical protein
MLRRVIVLAAACLLALPVAAQTARSFPQNALRGVVVFGVAPEVALNGQAARLAPGSRLRDANNMMIVPSTLHGGKYLVHYTVDTYGLIKDVWILTADEAAKRPWPTKPEEAQAWGFDPIAQVWVRP